MHECANSPRMNSLRTWLGLRGLVRRGAWVCAMLLGSGEEAGAGRGARSPSPRREVKHARGEVHLPPRMRSVRRGFIRARCVGSGSSGAGLCVLGCARRARARRERSWPGHAHSRRSRTHADCYGEVQGRYNVVERRRRRPSHGRAQTRRRRRQLAGGRRLSYPQRRRRRARRTRRQGAHDVRLERTLRPPPCPAACPAAHAIVPQVLRLRARSRTPHPPLACACLTCCFPQ